MAKAFRPNKEWWTPKELAEANLPGLPTSERRILERAKRFAWRTHARLARRRTGKGGGWEYHWTLLPEVAQARLLAQARKPAAAPATEPVDRTEAWAFYEQQTEKHREVARMRLEAIQMVETLAPHVGKDHAVREVARLRKCSYRAIWTWLALVEGIRLDDRLAYLIPRYSRAGNRGTKASFSQDFWEFLKSDYLRPSGPNFRACYRRALRVAEAEGWETAGERTMRRHLERDVSELTMILHREGSEALKRRFPSQTRDRLSLEAMEAVNADYHRFDVFVRWPLDDGSGGFEIVRPQMVAFQDIYSGRILSWRIDRTPNKVGVSLALGDMIERFGIPERIVLDNGREFANKFLTGGVPTRFRFKVKDDDIPGVLVQLGINVHWATPYSGQSKPIERAFRDLCEDIAKDPRFEGAYTGNRPDAKPENYGSRAIALEEFIRIVSEGIEEHNARGGRRGQTTMGRSILETFEESYRRAPIRKATAEQRRLWLMGAEGVNAHAKTGLIKFMGNEYWSAWMHEIAGQKVVARFDPADLRAGLQLYRLDGTFLGQAACKLAAGFFDLEEARAHKSAQRRWMKAEKEAAEAARRFDAAKLGEFLDGAAPPDGAPTEPLEAKVVSLPRARPLEAPRVQPAPMSHEERAAREAFVADFNARKAERQRPTEDEDDPRFFFRRALEMEARQEAGEPLTRDQERWLSSYQQTPEYRAQKRIHEDLGSGFEGGGSGAAG
ncbi:transposase domain-containing protein [Litorisediminicola beolgyonensis]|uniref:Transposase domain-containing protein n=1 Tax=Litorisediminicola beolgyonensis TaxID=1173614 RepID=A0ABW3ZIG5_9RHOB